MHIGQAVMHADATVDRFLHATFNIPTRSEVYKYAAYDALQTLAGRPTMAPIAGESLARGEGERRIDGSLMLISGPGH